MSPRIVVSDSSVLIDLERGCLFDAAFALPFDFCVPDLLYRLELEPYGGNELVAKGLQVLELDGDGVAQAASYHQTKRAISLPDAFALALARRTGSTLLTGDAHLRQLAVTEKVACHGVLWLIDRMFEHRSATPTQLHAGLVKIRDHPRCRLPKAEVNKRLHAFESHVLIGQAACRR